MHLKLVTGMPTRSFTGGAIFSDPRKPTQAWQSNSGTLLMPVDGKNWSQCGIGSSGQNESLSFCLCWKLSSEGFTSPPETEPLIKPQILQNQNKLKIREVNI